MMGREWWASISTDGVQFRRREAVWPPLSIFLCFFISLPCWAASFITLAPCQHAVPALPAQPTCTLCPLPPCRRCSASPTWSTCVRGLWSRLPAQISQAPRAACARSALGAAAPQVSLVPPALKRLCVGWCIVCSFCPTSTPLHGRQRAWVLPLPAHALKTRAWAHSNHTQLLRSLRSPCAA